MPPMTAWHLLWAWLLDAAIGDPPLLMPVHPVVWIGKLITFLEKILLKEKAAPAAKLATGALLWFLVVGTSVLAAFLLLAGAESVSPLLGSAVTIVLSWWLIATGDLARQVKGVAAKAGEGDLDEARKRLSMIVGRDTQNLETGEICRAAFETAAENSSDGIVAPLFYITLGAALGLGPLLGVAYKAVNTLDSMVAYKNARYLHFGRFSARMDDAANFIPARLTALIVLQLSVFMGSGMRTLKIIKRDAGKHSSPNSGYPEAAFAGAAGVMIGGTNRYGGIERASPKIGEAVAPMDTAAVMKAVKILWGVSFATLLLCMAWLMSVTQAGHSILTRPGL